MDRKYIDLVDVDVKPVIGSNSCGKSNDGSRLDLPSSSGNQKWSPGSWEDGIRKSAFQPYKQTSCTVLTNLQRGNTQAATPVPQPTDVNFHTRAGQGEITELDVFNEKSVDICDDNGLTALHWAANYGQINAVKLLVASKADVNKKGPDGETPLLLAAGHGHHEVVKFLLTVGANVNHVDDGGNSALMYGTSGNFPHTCNELLQQGADLTAVSLNDATAFSLAVDNGSYLAQAVIENHLLELLK